MSLKIVTESLPELFNKLQTAIIMSRQIMSKFYESWAAFHGTTILLANLLTEVQGHKCSTIFNRKTICPPWERRLLIRTTYLNALQVPLLSESLPSVT